MSYILAKGLQASTVITRPRVCYAGPRRLSVTDRPNSPPGGSVPPNVTSSSQLPAPPGGTGGASIPPGGATSKVPSGVHSMRRGGARREVTERVTFTTEDGKIFDGWALNVSRGGLRAILEDKVVLGQKFDIALGTEDVMHRAGRIVWVQEEPDGVIVGIEFTGMSGPQRSVPPPPPGSQSEPGLVAATESDVATTSETAVDPKV